MLYTTNILFIIIFVTSNFNKSEPIFKNVYIKECINNDCKTYSQSNVTTENKTENEWNSKWINQTFEFLINQISDQMSNITHSANNKNSAMKMPSSNKTDSIIRIGEEEYSFPVINQHFAKNIVGHIYPDYESMKSYVYDYLKIIRSGIEKPIIVRECPHGSECTELHKCTEIRVKLNTGVYIKNDIEKIICHSQQNRVCCTPDQILYLLPSNKCGDKANDFLGSNGIIASPFEYPWMALITNQTNLKSGKPFKAFCGGFLISDRYVLTSAHCVHDTTDSYAVRLAEHNIENKKNCIKGSNFCTDKIDINVETVIIHPYYSLWENINDVALLRLSKVITFDEFVSPICLPFNTTYDDSKLSNLEVAGWGATEKSIASIVLLKSYFNFSPFDECNKYYENLLMKKYTICAVGLNGNSDTCKGDSGGPLMAYHYGRMVAFGIVKLGRKNVACGKNINKPGVYERISTHMEFILNNMH